MKALLALFAVFVAVALAQTPPDISDDFTANVIVVEEQGNHKVKFDGVLYEDYTKRMQRIDTSHNHEQPTNVEFLRLYDIKKEYEIVNSKTCKSRPLNKTMPAAFNWVKKGANLVNRECHAKFRNVTNGLLWEKTTHELHAMLCVDRHNQNSPLWVEVHPPGHKSRRIDFKTFTAGEPNQSVFTVPSTCN